MVQSIRGRLMRLASLVMHPFGVTLLPSWRLSRLHQADYVRRVLREWRVTSVIDVGANAGQFRQFLVNEVRFDGPVLSIEPIPELAAGLKARAARGSRWIVEEMALGPSTSTAEFRVTEGSEFSSLLDPLDGVSQLFDGQPAVRKRITVQVDTIDRVIQRHDRFLGERIYLKLDTQGFDLEAMCGLHSERERVVALQSEAAVKPLYNGMPTYHETIAAVEARGYTVSQFFPNNAGHFPKLFEFDCHFVDLSRRS